jgi:hypothetical protein
MTASPRNNNVAIAVAADAAATPASIGDCDARSNRPSATRTEIENHCASSLG